MRERPPPSRHGEVLCLVERGWRGARECSLALNARAIPVTYVIKGYVTPALRAMIRPYPAIRLLSAPRALFRCWVWWALGWGAMTRRLRCVLVDHERTLREISWWCRLWRVTPVTIREHDQGYELWVENQRRPFASVFAW